MDFTEASSDAGEVVDAKPTSPVSSPATLSVPPRNTANCFTKTLNSSATPRDSVSRGFTGSESFSRLLAAAMLVESLDNPAFTMSTSQSSVPVAPLLVERDDANTNSGENISPGVARSSIAEFMTNRPVGFPLSQSPILLSTEQAEPSPTTGGLSLPLYIYPSGLSCVSALNTFKDQMPDGGAAFIFKPIASLGNNHWSTLINLGSFGVSHQQALEQVEAHAQAQAQAQAQLLSLPGNIVTFATTTGSDCSYDAAKFVSPAQIRDLPECTSQALVESSMQAQDLQPLAHQPYLVETSSEDDYNWRKYGQKQLKCGEYPRSYYKCTYPSCLVKKRVERSLDGQVMKIVYKGEHNHVKPNSNYRVSADAAYMLDGSGREVKGLNACIKADQSNEAHNLNTETELTSAFSDPSLSRANGTPDPSSVSICVDDAAHSKINDGHNEPDSKRRKKEKANEKAPLALIRTIPEPRIVVQTTNEADILDDGHRWRKYGQKIVKGSPHPRSYYRCTNLGCSVRKHVERSSIDPKAVILTYEGKHNHEMHAAQSDSKNFNGNSKPATNSVAKASLS